MKLMKGAVCYLPIIVPIIQVVVASSRPVSSTLHDTSLRLVPIEPRSPTSPPHRMPSTTTTGSSPAGEVLRYPTSPPSTPVHGRPSLDGGRQGGPSTVDPRSLKPRERQGSVGPSPSSSTMAKIPTSLISRPPVESLDGDAVDVSFYDSLIKIIKGTDSTFSATLTPEQFSTHCRDVRVFEVLGNSRTTPEARDLAVGDMLNAIGQRSDPGTRKTIRENVVAWIRAADHLRIFNLIWIQPTTGIALNVTEVQAVLKQFAGNPFSLKGYSLTDRQYVELHKDVSKFLRQVLDLLQAEKVRYEQLIQDHRSPAGGKLGSFRKVLARDILNLWHFSKTSNLIPALMQSLHRAYPDTFALDFRLTVLKLLANFDFIDIFDTAKTTMIKAIERPADEDRPKVIKTYEQWMKDVAGSEYKYWISIFGAEALHAKGQFFFLTNPKFLKNVASSFLDIFGPRIYKREIAAEHVLIPFFDSPFKALYTNRGFFSLLHKKPEQAAHYLAYAIIDLITSGTPLSNAITRYTQLVHNADPAASPGNCVLFRRNLEQILADIVKIIPGGFKLTDRQPVGTRENPRVGARTNGSFSGSSASYGSSSSSSSSSRPSGSSSSSTSESSTSSHRSSRDHPLFRDVFVSSSPTTSSGYPSASYGLSTSMGRLPRDDRKGSA